MGPTPVRWLCVDSAAVDDVDFSAAATLREICTEMKDRSIRLVFANAADHVRHELDISGIAEIVGFDAFYLDQFEVLTAYVHLPARRLPKARCARHAGRDAGNRQVCAF